MPASFHAAQNSDGPPQPIAVRLAIAFLATAAALVTSLVLEPYLEGELVSALFLMAVFVGVRQGGIAAGIFATVLSALAFDWLPAGPHVIFFPQGQGNAVRLGLFFGISAFIVYSVYRQQVALQRAAESERLATQAALRQSAEAAQRLQAEHRAEEQARHLETVLGGLQDAVLSVDAQGHITYLNEEATRLLGATAEACLGKPLTDRMRVVDADSGQAVEPVSIKVLREGRAVRDEGSRAIIGADEVRVPIDVSAAPLHAHDGKLLGAVTIVRNVSARRAAEQALRSSEERFRLATEAGDMGVWLWRPQTDEAVWNGTLSAMLQVGGEDYKGPAGIFFDRIHKDDLAGLHASLALSLAEHLPFEYEFRIAPPDGGIRWLVTTGRTVAGRHPEPALALAGVTFDITDRKHAERKIRELNRDLETLTAQLQVMNLDLRQRSSQLEAMNAAKTKFLSNMSHELRTPLNTICGFVELLMEQDAGDLNDRQNRYLRNIDASAHHLIRVVSDVLDLSRIAAGRVDIHPESVPLAEIVHESVAAFSPMADEHRVSLETAVPSSLRALADRQRMRQVLSNLISNAIKFTQPGGRVLVEAAQGQAGIEIRVTDSGIGIPEAELGRIFEEFEQVHHEQFRPQERGSGLGLAITRQLVQLQGGTVEVTSAIGKGSTFRILLPCAPALSAQAITASE